MKWQTDMVIDRVPEIDFLGGKCVKMKYCSIGMFLRTIDEGSTKGPLVKARG